MNRTVHIRRIPRPASEPRLIHQHPNRLTHGSLPDLIGNTRLNHRQLIGAALARRVVHLILHLGGQRPLLARIRENPGALKTELADKIAQLRVILLRLPRQAADKRRTQTDIRHRLAHLAQQAANIIAIRHAPLLLENVIRNMLQGNIHILHHLLARRHRLNQLAAPMRRMRVEHANPKIAGNPVNLAQQRSKRLTAAGIHPARLRRLLLPAIHTVIRRILCNEINLLHPPSHKPLHLAQHIRLRTAAMAAANARNRAVRTSMIAALRNLHVSIVRRRQTKARRREIRQQRRHLRAVNLISSPLQHRLNNRHNLTNQIHPHEAIRLGQRLHQILSVALRQAARYHNLLIGRRLASLARASRRQNRINRLLLSRVDKSASIDQQHLRRLRLNLLITRRQQAVGHEFRIHKIFRATERNEGEASHERSIARKPPLGKLICRPSSGIAYRRRKKSTISTPNPTRNPTLGKRLNHSP